MKPFLNIEAFLEDMQKKIRKMLEKVPPPPKKNKGDYSVKNRSPTQGRFCAGEYFLASECVYSRITVTKELDLSEIKRRFSRSATIPVV